VVATQGRRELRKRRLREQLSLAALGLARERGLANVRVSDIVDRVGVCRRTFSNYFSSKEDAIVDRQLQQTLEIAAALRDRPDDEPLWDALTATMIRPIERWTVAGEPDEDERAGLRRLLGEPSLQAALARGSNAVLQELTQTIAERTGTDPAQDLFPTLVAAAALNALLLAFDFWLRADPPRALVPLMRGAFHQLKAGLDVPLTRGAPEPCTT
jgi:AcrR family transcriptional regulator